jgi:2-hydroxycyclohexanecarboxyl-CoA dehydrogenase
MVALVTGAAGGIGQAIVERLGQEGARVVLADVDGSGLERVSSALSSIDPWPINADITSRAEVDRMSREIEGRWGRIDILVNNAGRTRVGPFITSKAEEWEELLRIDVVGMLQCTQSVLPGMVARRSGRIINIASDAARSGLAGQAVYAAAKGAVIAFTKSLAREVAADGVLVNAVSPGPVNTPPLQRLFERQPDLARRLLEEIPMGRVAEVADVAAMVAFLASEDARYITGQVLSVNGGWVMA